MKKSRTTSWKPVHSPNRFRQTIRCSMQPSFNPHQDDTPLPKQIVTLLIRSKLSLAVWNPSKSRILKRTDERAPFARNSTEVILILVTIILSDPCGSDATTCTARNVLSTYSAFTRPLGLSCILLVFDLVIGDIFSARCCTTIVGNWARSIAIATMLSFFRCQHLYIPFSYSSKKVGLFVVDIRDSSQMALTSQP